MALYALQQDPRYQVVGLLTSFSSVYGRVSHHGVREELMEMQAQAIGLPLHKLMIPSSAEQPCSMETYQQIMADCMQGFADADVKLVAHGDIFLQDLRQRRERNLATLGMAALFPLWGRDTRELIQDFLSLGFKSYLTCVEPELGRAFAGRNIDADFLQDLPSGVDPCGEHGEYHSFVWDGPLFSSPLPIQVGDIVERGGRFYADLTATNNNNNNNGTIHDSP